MAGGGKTDSAAEKVTEWERHYIGNTVKYPTWGGGSIFSRSKEKDTEGERGKDDMKFKFAFERETE